MALEAIWGVEFGVTGLGTADDASFSETVFCAPSTVVAEIAMTQLFVTDTGTMEFPTIGTINGAYYYISQMDIDGQPQTFPDLPSFIGRFNVTSVTFTVFATGSVDSLARGVVNFFE